METQAPNCLKSQRLKALVMNGGGHAFDTRTGRSYSVNPTGQVIILMLQDGASRDEIIDRLCGLCVQPASVVESGVSTFMEQMKKVAS